MGLGKLTGAQMPSCQGRAGMGKKVAKADLGDLLVSPSAASVALISAQTDTSCEQGASCPP